LSNVTKLYLKTTFFV